MLTTTPATKIDEDNLTADLKHLLDTATIDYDTFWGQLLDERDRELTATLTRDDDYDTVLVSEGFVYGIWYNEITSAFEVWCLGSESELKVYVNEENTNLSGEALDAFIAELANDLRGLEIVSGQRTGLTYEMEYLEQNEYVTGAWESAMETACALPASCV